MKKHLVKILALTLATLLLSALLVSCNKLSGSYTAEDGTTYKFSPLSDKVIMIYHSIDIEGQYEIDEENGKIYLTILGDRQEHSYSKNGKTLIIDGVEYIKD